MIVQSLSLSCRMYSPGTMPIGLRYAAKAYAARFAVRRRSNLQLKVSDEESSPSLHEVHKLCCAFYCRDAS